MPYVVNGHDFCSDDPHEEMMKSDGWLGGLNMLVEINPQKAIN